MEEVASAEELIASLCEVLRSARPGEPLWCWTTNEVEPGYPPILLQPEATDIELRKIRALAARVPYPKLTAIDPVGPATFDEQGVLRLAGRSFLPDHLRGVAAWVRPRIASHPELAHFKDMQCMRGLAGERSVWEDPTLWEDIGAVPLRTTHAHTAQLLQQVSPGDRGLFALFDKGPDGGPHLLLQVGDSTAPQAFTDDIVQLRTRILEKGRPPLFGTMRVFESWIAWATDGRADAWQETLTDYIQAHEPLHPSLGLLKTVRLVQLRKGRLVGGEAL